MIAKGKVVSINYRLTDERGQELERTEKGQPFCYVHGSKTILRGLEAGLSGLKVGENVKITVPPGDAYGEYDDALCVKLDLGFFSSGQKLQVGDLYRITDDRGESRVYEIERIEGNSVYANANHPLAGQTLRFHVEVLSIRDASEGEMKSGEVAN